MSSNDALSTLTKSKLSLSSLSLHRWVLLKNSILSQSQNVQHPTTTTTTTTAAAAVASASAAAAAVDDEPVAKAAAVVVAAAACAHVAAQAEAEAEAQAAAFMFPDAGRFLDAGDAQMREAQWLDELLESLGEEEEDEDEDDDEESSDEEEAHRRGSNTVEDDVDVDVDYTPLVSPMSSMDDLHNHHHHHPHYNYTFQEDALPYYHSLNDDDIEEEEDYTMASVPDAIEDTSDDETCSDAPTTPSLGRSSNSFTLHPPPGGHPHPLSETRTQPHSPPTSPPQPPPPQPATTTTSSSTTTDPRHHHHHHHPRVYALDDSHSYFYGQTIDDEPWPVVDPLPFPLTHAYHQQC